MAERTSPTHLVRRGLRRAKALVGDHEALLPLYLRLTAEGADRGLGADTDLVIDGFQRSGTTFTAHAVQEAQPTEIVVANHVHNTAILRKAMRADIPTLVVVRPARGCLPSYVVWDETIGAKTVLWEWLHFHRQLPPLLDGLVVATFDQVTTDLGSVIDRLNARFDLALHQPPGDDPGFADRVEARLREAHRRAHPDRTQAQSVPMPDAGRSERLAVWRDRIERDDSLKSGLAEADEIFSALARHAR